MRFLRRLIICILLLALVAVAGYCYARYIEPHRLAVETLQVSGAGLASPVRLVVFSDVHLGNGVDTDDLRQLVDQINALQADAVLFLGDLYDNYEQYEGNVEADAAALAAIDAPVKLAVWGNHDMGGGAYRIYPEVLEKGGFVLLENESFAADKLGICFAGAADVIFGQPDISALWADGLYRVLLVHEPDYALEVTDVPLQLSGHMAVRFTCR